MLSPWALLVLGVSGTDDRLDDIAVDDASDIGVGDLRGGEAKGASISTFGVLTTNTENLHIVLLEGRCLIEGAENLIEKSECTRRPDDETSEVATRSQLEEVEAPDVDELNTREVAESLDDTIVLVVDNERTAALAMTAVPELALTRAELAGVGHLHDIRVRLELLEESDSLLSLLEALNSRVHYEGNLGNLLDAVTPGENEGRES